VCLFTVNLLFGIISYFTTKYIKENSEYFRFFVIFLAFLIGNIPIHYGFNLPHQLYTIYHLNTALVALLLYYIGYIYRKYEDKIDMNFYFVVIAMLFLITSSLYGQIDMASNIYLSPSFLIMNSLTGIYINIYLAKIIIAKDINYTILEYIGKNAFNIMALHFFSFKLINFIQVKLDNLPIYMIAKFPFINGANGWWMLYAVCGVFLPIISMYCIDKFTQKIKYTVYHFHNSREYRSP
jgi:fucose 4-O-acetylase-like acetyltransferase